VTRRGSASLAIFAAAIGPVLTLLWWLGGIGSKEYFSISLGIYGWAGAMAILGLELSGLTPWFLAAGVIAIALWAAQGVFGSIDLTPIIPLVIYLAALVLSLESDRSGNHAGP
jgi:hypothetical protein